MYMLGFLFFGGKIKKRGEGNGLKNKYPNKPDSGVLILAW